jgi:hypothetical protein
LTEFKLPTSVVEVASIVIGCVVYGIVNGLTKIERELFLVKRLEAHGYERFSDFARDGNAS